MIESVLFWGWHGQKWATFNSEWLAKYDMFCKAMAFGAWGTGYCAKTGTSLKDWNNDAKNLVLYPMAFRAHGWTRNKGNCSGGDCKYYDILPPWSW